MVGFNIHCGRFFFVCVILSVAHFFVASGAADLFINSPLKYEHS